MNLTTVSSLYGKHTAFLETLKGPLYLNLNIYTHITAEQQQYQTGALSRLSYLLNVSTWDFNSFNTECQVPFNRNEGSGSINSYMNYTIDKALSN